MLVLCTGMIRSGSTWSYNVCAALLRSAYGDRAVSGGYHESLDAWRDYAAGDEAHAVVKCHQVTPGCQDWIATLPKGRVAFVFTVRPPREIIASGINAFALSFDECRGSMQASLAFFAWQKSVGPVAVVPHAAIIAAPQDGVAGIARRLGLAPDSAEIAETARRYSRDAMAERVTRRFGALAEADVYRDERYCYHRPTLLHRTHFRSADAPDWPQLLDAKQQAQIDAEFSPWRALLEQRSVSLESAAG